MSNHTLNPGGPVTKLHTYQLGFNTLKAEVKRMSKSYDKEFERTLKSLKIYNYKITKSLKIQNNMEFKNTKNMETGQIRSIINSISTIQKNPQRGIYM